MLDDYRLSFGPAYTLVFEKILHELRQMPTGRPAKSTVSIIGKLQREKIRLTQMQDIAGCRIICKDIGEQEQILQSLSILFPEARMVDRREKPSHGYRAVHIIPVKFDKPVEIQIRTENQHLWAEISEKYADLYDPFIKYGGGSQDIQELLTEISNLIRRVENQEKRQISLQEISSGLLMEDNVEFDSMESELRSFQHRIYDMISDIDN